jgi:hypothetical protein
VLPGRRLSVHLMAQPAIAAKLLCDPLVAGSGGQGLLNRFLLAAPASTAGTRFFREPPSWTDETLTVFARHVENLLTLSPPLVEGKPNELAPRVVKLSAAAREKWIAYQHEIERKMGSGEELEPIRGFATRLPAHASRPATVQTLFSSLDAHEVTAETFASGIALANYYAAEALRQAVMATVSPDLRMAAQALEWLLTKWAEPLISLPDFYQLGPCSIRSRDVALRIMNVLVVHGHLLPEAGPAKVNGWKRRDVWRIAGKGFAG